MKVLLREDVDNLGYAGEVMEVANGYGRNYLIPQRLAVKASPGELKQARAWRDRAAVRLEELRKEHTGLADRINGVKLDFTARAGETGKLFGSVTNNDIVEQLNELLGLQIDKKKVISPPLRQVGEQNVTIRLSRDYQPRITVSIHSLESEEEESEQEAEEPEIEGDSDVAEPPAEDSVEQPSADEEDDLELTGEESEESEE